MTDKEYKAICNQLKELYTADFNLAIKDNAIRDYPRAILISNIAEYGYYDAVFNDTVWGKGNALYDDFIALGLDTNDVNQIIKLKDLFESLAMDFEDYV